jgi:hypothetical protein
LEQTLEVAPRVREDPGLWDSLGDDEYLVRVPREGERGIVWEDRLVAVPPVKPRPIDIRINREKLARAQQLPRGGHTLEVDLFMMPRPIVDEQGGRPFFPQMLLVVDRESGLVLGNELMTPHPSPEAMWGSLAGEVLECLLDIGSLPAQISVRSRFESQLLMPLADELGVEVKPVRALRSLDEARESLVQWFA